ncbi:hypothetical protein [Luteolibacter sp. Populi]|uniref:hypothetical protein n=1 Tax=Luteolibacter sp. Populi TaxID=3230487 RepID=UPI003465394F
MKATASILALLLSGISFGEGIPVEDGKLTVAHTIITPNASQVEEMTVLDSVTLTKEQWAELRKVSPNSPKRLTGIVPVTYNDCTCDMDVGAVLMKDGKIGVIHEEQTARSLAWRFDQKNRLDLKVDERGQFYFEGILVRFPVLLETIRTSKPLTKERAPNPWEGGAYISVPQGMSQMDAVFGGRLKELFGELASKGWNRGQVPGWIAPKAVTVTQE